MSRQEFKKLSYREQLSYLMKMAQKRKDMYAMQTIQDKINEHEKETASRS